MLTVTIGRTQNVEFFSNRREVFWDFLIRIPTTDTTNQSCIPPFLVGRCCGVTPDLGVVGGSREQFVQEVRLSLGPLTAESEVSEGLKSVLYARESHKHLCPTPDERLLSLPLFELKGVWRVDGSRTKVALLALKLEIKCLAP